MYDKFKITKNIYRMKSIKLSILALFIASASFAQVKDSKAVPTKELKTETTKVEAIPAEVKTPATPAQSAIKWDQEMHDFGDIEKGKPVTYEFSFTNNTKETILITNVRPACGVLQLITQKRQLNQVKKEWLLQLLTQLMVVFSKSQLQLQLLKTVLKQ